MLQGLRSPRTYAEPDSIGALTSGYFAFVVALVNSSCLFRARRLTYSFPVSKEKSPKVDRAGGNSVYGLPLRIQGGCRYLLYYDDASRVLWILILSPASIFQARALPNTSFAFGFFIINHPIQGVSEPFRKGHERSQISKGSSSSYVSKKRFRFLLSLFDKVQSINFT